MNKATATLHFDELLINGIVYTNVDLHVIDVIVTDVGIGHYDCHGFEGFDSRMAIDGFDIDYFEAEGETLHVKEDGLPDKSFDLICDRLNDLLEAGQLEGV
jgi:hypothetical protein